MSPNITASFLGVLAVAGSIIYFLSSSPKRMSPTRFVLLSVIAGFLVVLSLGGLYGTPLATAVLGVKQVGIKDDALSRIKAILGLSAALLSVLDGLLAKRWKQPCPPHVAKGIGLALAIVSIGAYYRFGDLGYANFYHRWEFYHYYMGSKYHQELGYERLYACTAIAQHELGQKSEVLSRKLRNLEHDQLQPAKEVIEHPEQCRDRFTPERWEAYKQDVKWFRASSNITYWNDMQKDHGYNPPPVWTVMGSALASLEPAGDIFFKRLALIDLGLFAGAFAAIYWAFGWRVFAVAATFWGTQLPAEYFWTGGAFLRQDWFFFLILSACLIRKRRYAWGGAAFAYSTLLRVFPGALVVGWAVQIGVALFRRPRKSAGGTVTSVPLHRRIPAPLWKLMAGGAIATVVLFGTSVQVAGWHSWPEFAKHIQVHNQTPLTNNMGLTTVLQQSWEGRMKYVRDEKLLDPFGPWKNMRLSRLRALRPLQITLYALMGAAFFIAVRRMKSVWSAQALSVVWIVALVELTCYYYTFFLLLAMLTKFRRGLEQALLCLGGVSQIIALNRWFSHYYDDRYVSQSIAFAAFSVAILFAFWPAAKSPRAAQSKDPAAPEGLPKAAVQA